MKDKILVNVGTDHSFHCTAKTIGRAGECNSTQIVIQYPDKLRGCSVYLDIEKPNGETIRTPRLVETNGFATYDVPLVVLTESGDIKMQVVFENDEGVIWKSSTKTYQNHTSINAVDDNESYIKPNGTFEITDNGTFNIMLYKNVQVNVPRTEVVEEWDGSCTKGAIGGDE